LGAVQGRLRPQGPADPPARFRVEQGPRVGGRLGPRYSATDRWFRTQGSGGERLAGNAAASAAYGRAERRIRRRRVVPRPGL